MFNKFLFFSLIGSPFSVNVGGQGSGRLKESIIRERRAVDITHIGSQCELSLKIPGKYSLYLIYFLSVITSSINNICRKNGGKETSKRVCAYVSENVCYQ
jgi:hypothetical protein